MNRFLSTFTMRLDAKGRVSIPAPFRAALARDGHEGLYCHPALDRPAVDAGGSALLSEIESLIDRYPPFSEEREEFSAALFGRSETLKPDSEGRIMLTDSLKEHAQISDAVTFVGLGHKFQMWEPTRFQSHLTDATEKVRAFKRALGASGKPSGASSG